MALFGEKYGAVVRVVSVPDYSVEFCGGTHAENTGRIGLFRIVSENGVAAGVRRIEAVTGLNTLELLRRTQRIAADTAAVLKAGGADDIVSKATQLTAQLKESGRHIAALESKLAAGKTADIMGSARAVGELRVATAVLEGVSPDELRRMTDSIKAENDNAVAVLATVNGEKLTFCACCGKKAVADGAHAGNLVREIAKLTGGNGGGKADSAMAGGKDASRAAEALEKAAELVGAMLR